MLQAAVLRKSEHQVGSVEAVKEEGEGRGDRGKGSALGEGGGGEKVSQGVMGVAERALKVFWFF